MKHSLALKFIAMLLAAMSLVTAIGGGAGIFAMEQSGLYVNGLEKLQSQEYESVAKEIANRYANKYAADKLGKIPYKLKKSIFPDPTERSDAEHWRVKLQQGDEILADPGDTEKFGYVMEFTITPLYPITVDPDYKPPEEDPESATGPAQGEEGETPNEPPRADWEQGLTQEDVPSGYLYRETENLWENGSLSTYHLYYYEAPQYTVTVYMQEEVLQSSAMHMLTAIYPYRYTCIGILIAGLIIFAASMVFLFWAAGKNAKGEVHPGGLNRLPLDLYAVLVGLGLFALGMLFSRVLQWMRDQGPHPGNLSLLALNVLAIIVLPISFGIAFAAQIKMDKDYWWSHSILGWCAKKAVQGIGIALRGIREVFRLLPLVWQWLVTALVMAAAAVAAWMLFSHFGGVFLVLLIAAAVGCIGVVLYGAYAYGTLMRGIHRMTAGELNYKVSTKYLVGSFLDFAEQLNSLSETAMIAAQQQTRAERMRTELITNVSHDIKTPLTSIINFVDLMQKPHTPKEGEEYLEVLSRQSRQMKKLIEDLVELSKVNSGNITLNLQKLDVAETVNQVLGEFSDKLDAAKLIPVFVQPAQPVTMLADGKLVWRVLSNLLSNVIKYAMPDTRVYIDLMQVEDKAVLSLKNISRQQLSQPAEELMERFVRGDAARNSDGSGLGLNIAKSLMQLQGGKLQLLVDGDLFKVTLVFPCA